MKDESFLLIKYVGRPYEEYNCFALVKDFYREFFDIDLSHYYDRPQGPTSRREVETLIVSNKGDLDQVDAPVFGDLIIINLYGYSCHVAVALDGGNMLHTIRKVGSCIEPIKKYQRMIEGYYRHNPRKELSA